MELSDSDCRPQGGTANLPCLRLTNARLTGMVTNPSPSLLILEKHYRLSYVPAFFPALIQRFIHWLVY